MPQVWRTNLAADIKLPWDMTFTLEGLYTKDINAILQQNVNEKAPTLNFAGSDSRPRYLQTGVNSSGAPVYDNKINSTISNAMVLRNTGAGYQYSVTAQLMRDFSHGFEGMVAYTFSEAKDVTSNAGDQAASAWQANVATGSLNDPGLSDSYFSVPHRVVAALSYRFSYARSRLATGVSLFYEGAPQGRLNYIYSNDLNGDGNVSDLLYIPKDEADIVFTDKGTMTAADQKAAFFSFLAQDAYLSSHRGEYAQRFGAVMPWMHRFNLKIVQDLVVLKARDSKIQLTLDILNLGNLLNSSWGVRKVQITGSNDNIPLLEYAGTDTANRPMFRLPVNSIEGYYRTTYKNVPDYSSTWSMQLGLRFLF
jgi:hypothetical protein